MELVLEICFRGLMVVALFHTLSEASISTTVGHGLSPGDINVCPDHQEFCVASGSCVTKGSCDPNGIDFNREHCRPGYVFCLQAGKCIPSKDQACFSHGTVKTCPPGHILCLETGLCIPSKGGCQSRNGPCLQDKQLFCLSMGQCVKKSSCGQKGITTASTAHPSTTTINPAYGKHRVVMVPHPLTYDEPVTFKFEDLGLPAVQTGQSLRINCDRAHGLVFSRDGNNEALTDSDSVLATATLTVTSSGRISGFVACEILGLPATITLGYSYHIGALVIPKYLPKPDVSMVTAKATVNEGTMYWTASSDLFKVEYPDFSIQIDSTYEFLNDKETAVKKYHEKLKQMQDGMRLPYLSLTVDQIPKNGEGLPMMYISTRNGIEWHKAATYSGIKVRFALGTELFRINLNRVFNGQITVRIENGGLKSPEVFNLEVLPVNNAPKEKDADKTYKMLVHPYEGEREFVVGRDIAQNIFLDEDGDLNLGLAIINTVSDQLGTWQFDNGNGNGWQPIPVSQLSAIGDSGREVPVTLLRPTDKLKFVPASPDLWTIREALKNTVVNILGWDGSNEKELSGLDQTVLLQRCADDLSICGPGGDSSYSRIMIKLVMTRAGCDNKPGSMKMLDQCGVCGGNNDCYDCNGVLNGGAVIDDCQDCTGGDTNLAINYRKDCLNQCGLHYVHSVYGCVPKGIDEATLKEIYAQCDGQLKSDAYINKCGHCVLGNTNLAEDYGMNDCGSCDQDTSCLDCQGTPYGPYDTNVCGQCLVRTDDNFYKGCTKLGSVEPHQFGASGVRNLRIRGAGLASYSSASCLLRNVDNSETVPLNTKVFSQRSGEVNTSTGVLSVDNKGTYRLSCTFDGTDELELTGSRVEIFHPELSSISPSQLNIGQDQKVTILGTGIKDTGYIKCGVICAFVQRSIQCFYDHLTRGGFILFNATRISETRVQCDLLNYFKRASRYRLFVLLEPLMSHNMGSLSTVQYSLLAPAPQPRSAKFHSTLCSVKIKFDSPVEGSENCQDLFDSATYSKLGTDSHCSFLGDHLTISFGYGQFSLRPDDTLTFKAGSIYREKSNPNFATPVSGSVTVQAPDMARSLKAELVGPSSGTLGNCDRSNLYLRISAKGCMKIAYQWTVALSSKNTPTTAVQQDLATIQAKLDALPRDSIVIHILESEIVAGFTYVYTVSMTTDMNMFTLKPLSIAVTRSVDVKPLAAQLHVFPSRPDPSKPITLLYSPIVSPCGGINLEETELFYDAYINSTEAEIFSASLNQPSAKIKPGTLKGGSTYNVTVTVFTSDSSHTDTTSTTFTTISQPLRLILAPYVKTMFSAEVVFDASRSYDPDDMPGKPTFRWRCVEKQKPDIPLMVKFKGSNIILDSLVAPADPHDARLTLPPSLVPVGRYIWNLTMTKGTRSTTSSFHHEVVESRAPSVRLLDLEYMYQSNPNEPIRIKSKVTSFGFLPVEMYWNCVDETGYDYINLDKFTQGQGKTVLMKEVQEALSDYDFSLFLPYGLPPGGRYKIQLTVIAGEEKLTGHAAAVVYVNSAPSIGIAQVSPLTGVSMETQFILTIGEGWVDDNDDTVLFYISVKKVGTNERTKENIQPLKDQMEHKVYLPEGEFHIFLRACDLSEACVIYQLPEKITVTRKVMTDDDVTSAVTEVKNMLKKDIDGAFIMAMSLSEAVDRNVKKQELGELLNDVSYKLLLTSEASFDKEEAVRVLRAVIEVIKTMAEMVDLAYKTLLESQAKAYQLAVVDEGSRKDDTRKRRRKRAVPSGSETITVSAMSVTEAETIMSTYSVTFSSQEDDEITSESARNYLTAMDSVRKGLCAGITYVEDAAIVESNLNTVRVKKMTTDLLVTGLIDVTCHNCSVNHTATIFYGEEIQSTYHHWNCTATEECYGACFTSSQMTRDLVKLTSADRYTIDLIRRSDIVTIKMLNPSTYDIIPVEALSTPVQIVIPVQGEVNLTEYSLQCMKWGGSNWVNGSCTTHLPDVTDMASVYSVNCTCNTLGLFSVFEAPPLSKDSTTMMSTATSEEVSTGTTESQTVTNQTPRPSVYVPATAEKVYSRFKLHNDYDSIVAPDVIGFAWHLVQTLANFLIISESRIINMEVKKGSILVMFEILPRSSSSELTMGEVLYKLQYGIQTASLTVTDTNGSSLVVGTNSFSWSVQKFTNVEEEDTNITIYVVAGAAGGFVLILITVLVGLYMLKTKKKSRQVMHAPFGQNMQGVDVPRPSSVNKLPISPVIDNWTVNETGNKFGREVSTISRKSMDKPPVVLPPIE